MIRYATDGDRDAVAGLWKNAFGDSDRYIRFAVENLFRPERCLLAAGPDGDPMAMLHLLPAAYADGNGTFPVQYIYAAATWPVFRRQGWMSALIDAACEAGEKAGCRFTCLLPAGRGLYDYYGKRGFRPAFNAKRAVVSRTELVRMAGGAQPVPLRTAGIRKIGEWRRSRFQPAVLWGPEMLAYVLAEWRFGGGELLAFDEGYLLCRHCLGRVTVKELCADSKQLPGIFSMLLRRYSGDGFEFLLPASSTTFADAESFPYGMVRIGAGGEPGTVPEETYFNLMLD